MHKFPISRSSRSGRFEWNHVYDYDAVVRGLKEITFIYTTGEDLKH